MLHGSDVLYFSVAKVRFEYINSFSSSAQGV